MQPDAINFARWTEAPKSFVRQLLTIGENRLGLLMVEVQQERERYLRGVLLALGIAVCGFLSGIALTAALVVWLWAVSPIAVLLALAVLYGAGAAVLCHRLMILQRDWKTLPATIDQLRKDRACIEQCLA